MILQISKYLMLKGEPAITSVSYLGMEFTAVLDVSANIPTKVQVFPKEIFRQTTSFVRIPEKIAIDTII